LQQYPTPHEGVAAERFRNRKPPKPGEAATTKQTLSETEYYAALPANSGGWRPCWTRKTRAGTRRQFGAQRVIKNISVNYANSCRRVLSGFSGKRHFSIRRIYAKGRGAESRFPFMPE